jgi:hypothetical protein
MIITQEYLQKHFYYNDGMLYRKHNVANNKVKAHEAAGRKHKAKGYYRICIENKRYPLHVMIYLYHYGFIPTVIDHIDCNIDNNRIENLRAVTHTWNNTNKKRQKNNSSGIKGISIYPKYNRIHAQIQIHRKKIHKTFVPISEENMTLAKNWLNEQREKLHGEYANYG